MGMMGRLAIGAAGAGMALALAAVAVGPRLSDWYDGRHREQVSYASGSAAKAGHRPVPGWLPDNASAVHYLLSTTSDDRLLRATLPGGKLPAGCTVAGNGRPGAGGSGDSRAAQGQAAQVQTGQTRAGEAGLRAARLRAAWFPADRTADVTGRCGDYAVALAGDQLFAWHDSSTVQSASPPVRATGR